EKRLSSNIFFSWNLVRPNVIFLRRVSTGIISSRGFSSKVLFLSVLRRNWRRRRSFFQSAQRRLGLLLSRIPPLSAFPRQALTDFIKQDDNVIGNLRLRRFLRRRLRHFRLRRFGSHHWRRWQTLVCAPRADFASGGVYFHRLVGQSLGAVQTRWRGAR